MFFASDHQLTRSSVFKVLLLFFTSVTLVYSLFVHQIFRSSESYHRDQLSYQLAIEREVLTDVALGGLKAVEIEIEKRRLRNEPFQYRIERRESMPTNTYPVASSLQTFQFGAEQAGSIKIDDQHLLSIKIKEELLQGYRDAVLPTMLTSVALPIVLILAGVSWFAISVIKKLQRVNHAVNRVMCGEKRVKLPVSRNDDEFDILAIHLNYMIEQMENNETSLRALTVGIAHDLRTPLARIKLRLEQLIQGQSKCGVEKGELEACHDDLELLLQIFNSMLEISRLNGGQQLLKRQPLKLSEIAADVVEFLYPVADEKNQQLSMRIDKNITIDGDSSLLFRAIFNLAENAVKYTPEGGRISVVIDHFGLVVVDNGPGVAQDDLDRIREPMYRADKSRTETGNGLGLALVDAIAKRHGAQLVFRHNKPGLRVRMLFRKNG